MPHSLQGPCLDQPCALPRCRKGRCKTHAAELHAKWWGLRGEREKAAYRVKNTPDNTVLFRRQNADPQSFTTTRDNPRNARPQNNKRDGTLMRFNPASPVSVHPVATEARRISQKMPTLECRKDVAPIVATPDPGMLRRAKLARIARDGPNSSDTPQDVAESGWTPKDWNTVVKERYV